MSVKNFKIPLKGHNACLSFSELQHRNGAGDSYTTYEIALLDTDNKRQLVFIGEPIQVYDLTEAHDILYTVINQEDWSYFMNQYEIELEMDDTPELQLVVDNDND